MPYTLNYENAGFIRLVYAGEANLNDMKEVIARGVALASEKNCLRILSDFRSMRLNLSIMDLYSIPSLQKSQGILLNSPFYQYKRAVIVPTEDYKKYKFFEDVAVNRAHKIKIFTDEAEAVHWLLQP